MKNYIKPQIIEEEVIVEDVIAASSGSVDVASSTPDYTDNNPWKF